MKNIINTIDRKIIMAQMRASEALKNDEGMEVVQFLGIALLSITLAAALVTGLSGTLDETIEAAGTKLNTLFDFS